LPDGSPVPASAASAAGGVQARPAAHWFVYLLCCADDTLYTGVTTDLARRLAEHNAGTGARYTRARLPVTLAYAEPAADRRAACQREAAIKRWPRAQKLDLIDGKPMQIDRDSSQPD
jgi:putative endonuclease